VLEARLEAGFPARDPGVRCGMTDTGTHVEVATRRRRRSRGRRGSFWEPMEPAAPCGTMPASAGTDLPDCYVMGDLSTHGDGDAAVLYLETGASSSLFRSGRLRRGWCGWLPHGADGDLLVAELIANAPAYG
jgi:hypothetical protein